ncbi:nicotinate-nucleotide adenylyltransferase [Acetobacterium sp.]|uniref:nicotinate-nucleotide adenylyltransferase n=1 Tax=Acetobacterium sp. TaxID=1872094 RepID=UPI002F3E2377
MKEKIGLFGGSFNPIHTGHLLLAESARDQYELDRVLFIPTGNNPFKISLDDISREHRLNMVELAIKNNPYFEVMTHEIDQTGITYTIDTIEEIKKSFPNSDFYFITGADLMFEITLWKGAPELLKSVKFITTFRPGYSHEKLDTRIEELQEIYDASIYKLYTSEMDITSSEIRSRVKNGYSIRYLLPKAVEEYIYKEKLYLPNTKTESE